MTGWHVIPRLPTGEGVESPEQVPDPDFSLTPMQTVGGQVFTLEESDSEGQGSRVAPFIVGLSAAAAAGGLLALKRAQEEGDTEESES